MSAAHVLRRILVVEDDDDLRGLLERVLADAGCEVVSAADGAQAIELLHARPVALVLLDLVLPIADGWAVLAHVRTLDPRPRVVVTSVRTEYDVYRRAAAEGVAAFVEKPFSIRGVAETCLEVLAHRRPERAYGQDRRDAPRHLVRLPARVTAEHGAWSATAEMLDFSVGGARVAVGEPLPASPDVTLGLDTPDGRPLALEGRVRWRVPVSRGFAYGLSFVSLSPEDRTRLLCLAPMPSAS